MHRLLPLHRGLLGRSCARWRENKELVVGSRRAEERVEIDQDFCRQGGGTRGMVDSQPSIIAENEWVGGFGFGTVRAPLRETPNPCRDQRCSSLKMSMMVFLSFDLSPTHVVGDVAQKSIPVLPSLLARSGG